MVLDSDRDSPVSDPPKDASGANDGDRDLAETPEDGDRPDTEPTTCVLVCQNRSCADRGSPNVLERLRQLAPEGIDVQPSGCLGQCSSGPTVRVVPEETWYWQVQPEDAEAIAEEHLKGGEPVTAKLNGRIHRVMRF